MQPPHPAAIARSKLSSHVCFKFSRPRPNRNRSAVTPPHPHPSVFTRPLASPSLRCSDGRCGSLLFEARKTRTPRLRNFDTEPYSSYCYEVELDNRLESVANAHTAADLRVRPVSKTALV